MNLAKLYQRFRSPWANTILFLLFLGSCQWPETQIELDRKRFGRISAQRPPGTECAENDSARNHRYLPTRREYSCLPMLRLASTISWCGMSQMLRKPIW